MDATKQGIDVVIYTGYRFIQNQVTQDQRDMFLASFLILKSVNSELPPFGGQCGGSYKFNGQQTYLYELLDLSRSRLSKRKYRDGLNAQRGHYTC